MPFPDDFPTWARAVSYIVVALGIGLTVLVGRLGILSGRQSGQAASSGGSAQVAAVIVDPAPLNRLTASAEAVNMSLIEMISTGKAIARATASAARSDAMLAKSVDRLAEGVDRLREEMIRAGKD